MLGLNTSYNTSALDRTRVKFFTAITCKVYGNYTKAYELFAAIVGVVMISNSIAIVIAYEYAFFMRKLPYSSLIG